MYVITHFLKREDHSTDARDFYTPFLHKGLFTTDVEESNAVKTRYSDATYIPAAAARLHISAL